MGMVYCAECGTKISEYAEACPHCGFKGTSTTALAVRKKTSIQPASWTDSSLVREFDAALPVSPSQKARFDNIFSSAETVMEVAPALFNALKAMLPDKVVAAKIPGEVQKLLDEGALRFVTDKNGEILPTIFKDGTMFKQVRLKELSVTPKLGRAVVDLQQQAALAEILHEVREVHESIKEAVSSLQNDRLARVDAVLQQLQQVVLISDARVREAKLLDITAKVTEAKCMLMYSFSEGMRFFEDRSGEKDFLEMVMDTKAQKEADKRSREQFQTLAALTRAVQAEATAYCLMDEQEVAQESLRQFAGFIKDNKLDDRKTLITLSQFNNASQKELISGFVTLQKSITALSSAEGASIQVLLEATEQEDPKEGQDGTDM